MESSQDKTKRKIIKELSEGEYNYRSVIFFIDYTPDVFKYASKIRKAVSRKIQTKLFWLIRTKRIDAARLENLPEGYSKKKIVQPYVQFFSSTKINTDMIDELLFSIDCDAYCSCWSFKKERKSQWLHTFKIQKLANLAPFQEASDTSGTARRWSITNKSY